VDGATAPGTCDVSTPAGSAVASVRAALPQHRRGPGDSPGSFTVSYVPKGEKVAWLSSDVKGIRAGQGRRHLVIVEVPDDVAAEHVYRVAGNVIPNLHCFPHDVINAYRASFRVEPFPDAEPPPDP
jgi:hypothetical protein